MNDWEDAVVRACHGDMDAYRFLIMRFQDMAVGYAYSVLGDFSLAEDAAQEAFIRVFLDLEKLQKPRSFPSWFRKVIFTQCNRLVRGKRIKTVPMERALEIPSERETPMESVEHQEERDQVLAAVKSLPKNEREVTTLYYINGYSQAEVGEFLELPVSTVKNRLYSARKKLRERITKMVKETLKQYAPDVDFSKSILDKTQVLLGSWSEENGVLTGKPMSEGGGRQVPGAAPWAGHIVTDQSWPGDALVVECDAMSPYGYKGASVDILFAPYKTLDEINANGAFIPTFSLRLGNYDRYRWSGVTYIWSQGRWSREGLLLRDPGDFTGALSRWYHLKAERIGSVLRFWVDGIPIYECQEDSTPPERIWVMFSATICPYNQTKNIKIYRPDKKYVKEHAKPMRVFAPLRQKAEILAKYPDQVIREATIDLSDNGEGRGIAEWPDGEGRQSIFEPDIQGRPCRRTDLANDLGSIGFRLEEPGPWNRAGHETLDSEIRLEIEYLDNGGGSIVGFHNTWYDPEVTAGDLLRKNSGEWKKHTFCLREAVFSDLGKQGHNLFFMPIRADGEDLYLRSARLVEALKPKEAYEEVIQAYRKEIQERQGQWTVPHYLYYLMKLLYRLENPDEAKKVADELFYRYPDSECVLAHQHMRAHIIAGR